MHCGRALCLGSWGSGGRKIWACQTCTPWSGASLGLDGKTKSVCSYRDIARCPGPIMYKLILFRLICLNASVVPVDMLPVFPRAFVLGCILEQVIVQGLEEMPCLPETFETRTAIPWSMNGLRARGPGGCSILTVGPVVPCGFASLPHAPAPGAWGRRTAEVLVVITDLLRTIWDNAAAIRRSFCVLCREIRRGRDPGKGI